MERLFTLILMICITAGCTREVFVIEEPETRPEKPFISDFEFEILEITDKNVLITIDTDVKGIFFDIAVNDSVVMYDLNFYGLCKIENLRPQTTYKISAIAHNKSDSRLAKHLEVLTRKPFVKAYYPVIPDYDFYSLTSTIFTSDGGVLHAGVFKPNILRSRPMKHFVMKYNADYSIVWKREFENETMNINYVKELHDGSFLVGWKSIVMKLSPSGDVVWTLMGPPGITIEEMTAAAESESGELFFTGIVLGGQKYLYLVMKTDRNGNLIWHKTGGTYFRTWSYGIHILPDGNLIFHGIAAKNLYIESMWMMKLDSQGNSLFEKMYPNNVFEGGDLPPIFTVLPDGNYLLSTSYYADVFNYGATFMPRQVKTDTHGNLISENFFFLDRTYPDDNVLIRNIWPSDSGYLMLFRDRRSIGIVETDSEFNPLKIYRGYSFPGFHQAQYLGSGLFRLLLGSAVVVVDIEGYLSPYPQY